MLAIDDGKPVRETFLPYGQQMVDDHDIETVVNVLKSSNLTQGPMIVEFEQRVANYVGAKYAVAFANGTAALHGAYFAAGLSEADEVITTPITFVATANAARYLGATVVFADIDNDTYNLNPDSVRKKITKNTKVITSVDFTGQPADYDAFRQIAADNNLVYISDGAHSLGALYNGKLVGTQADMTMFSFHPVKPITTGEGGIIVTDSAEYAEKLRLFRSHGITKTISGHEDEPWYYEMIELGFNYRMTDIQAALGVSQLEKLDPFMKRRREIANIYTNEFQSLVGVILPKQLECVASGWHLYILRFDLNRLRADRKTVFQALRAENIGVHVHYIPVHFQPYYQQLGYKKGICPIAEQWYAEVITLPIFPKMTDADVRDCVAAVKKIVSQLASVSYSQL